MCLLELDDFDFWVDENIANDIYKFSPVFVFIIGWAYEKGELTDKFIESKSLNDNYRKISTGEISFQTFVDEVLEGKLEATMFKESVREFVADYIELDGYSLDLSNYFKISMWDFPQDLKSSREIYSIISQSRCNYEKHKAKNPDLAIFDENYDVE